MKPGDYSALAEEYRRYRSGYAPDVLRALLRRVGALRPGFLCADVGAGTGIWTRMLLEAGVACVAVEPNDEMRRRGIEETQGLGCSWRKGSGEETGLDPESVDWVTMASSFHWVETDRGLREFHRILRPGGRFTALWNPRHLAGEAFDVRVEEMIREVVPDLRRVSSGGGAFAESLPRVLEESGLFRDVAYEEGLHEVRMTRERYLGLWRSVNDLQAQAGPARFAVIMARIEEMTAGMEAVAVPYRTRAWTARRA